MASSRLVEKLKDRLKLTFETLLDHNDELTPSWSNITSKSGDFDQDAFVEKLLMFKGKSVDVDEAKLIRIYRDMLLFFTNYTFEDEQLFRRFILDYDNSYIRDINETAESKVKPISLPSSVGPPGLSPFATTSSVGTPGPEPISPSSVGPPGLSPFATTSISGPSSGYTLSHLEEDFYSIVHRLGFFGWFIPFEGLYREHPGEDLTIETIIEYINRNYPRVLTPEETEAFARLYLNFVEIATYIDVEKSDDDKIRYLKKEIEKLKNKCAKDTYCPDAFNKLKRYIEETGGASIPPVSSFSVSPTAPPPPVSPPLPIGSFPGHENLCNCVLDERKGKTQICQKSVVPGTNVCRTHFVNLVRRGINPFTWNPSQRYHCSLSGLPEVPSGDKLNPSTQQTLYDQYSVHHRPGTRPGPGPGPSTVYALVSGRYVPFATTGGDVSSLSVSSPPSYVVKPPMTASSNTPSGDCVNLGRCQFKLVAGPRSGKKCCNSVSPGTNFCSAHNKILTSSVEYRRLYPGMIYMDKAGNRYKI